MLPPNATGAVASNTLRIASARYGGDNRYNDVRDRLQEMVRDNRLSVQADNNVLGGDPAVGKDKVLEVTYEWNGNVYGVSAREGRPLNLPDAGAQLISAMPTSTVVGRTADSDGSRAGGNRGYGGAQTTSPSGAREIIPIGREGGLRIFYARYGVEGRQIDVRERLCPLLGTTR